jgi:N-acyl-D-aspartate/D-glutamate deacylase
MLDVVIRGGQVVDGTGAPARVADIGIRDGRIVAIGEVTEDAARAVDATGLVVAPGFVDLHTHYDAQIWWDPMATPSNVHGVTTIIGGNCGFTLAPVRPEDRTYTAEMLARVEGMPLAALAEGVPWTWESFGEYLDGLDGRVAVNAASVRDGRGVDRSGRDRRGDRRDGRRAPPFVGGRGSRVLDHAVAHPLRR